MTGCDCCGGRLVYLGRLGHRNWSRCLDCGWDSGHDAADDCPYCDEDRRDGCDCYGDQEVTCD